MESSHISDVIYFINETVLKFKPKIIVFYAGDNDIHFGKTSQIVFEDYVNFVEKVHEHLPDTKIMFIQLNQAPIDGICGMKWKKQIIWYGDFLKIILCCIM